MQTNKIQPLTTKMSRSTTRHRIGPSRYEFNDPAAADDRDERCRMLEEFEQSQKAAAQRHPLERTMDRTLSPALRERTKHCIQAVPPRFQPPSSIATRQTDGDSSRPSHELGSLIPAQKATTVQVTIDPRTKPRPLPPRVENWMENFLRKPARGRVRWRSKLHEQEPRCSDRPPAERVEQLIDVGAQDFVDWLNTLGADRSSLTTDVVKRLFSIESADETSRALSIAPKEIRAVPGQVATEWNLPQLALENRIAGLVEHDRALARGGIRRTAFGRGLPQELRSGWKQDDALVGCDVERPDVPDDLMSLKRLFRDIWHLRSVKYLVDYLVERPALPRPRFLVEKGLFERQAVDEPVPFYRKVLSQKAIAESIKR
ncbi:uncharacterized protein LOC5667348 [Anopheles gambiae]|uniref:uncharacterized protein LOC5667348 n=2 Tax=gambiae species complex TaxID=44542 RepID=UPI002AC9BDBB|nr:uncharacterized protein LOC5667348 [Anopheles gambiae]